MDGRRVNITLDNVSYIPAARETRLFSAGTIKCNGSFIYQGDGNMSIYNSRPKGRVASGSTVEICGHRVIEALYVPHLNLYVLPLVIQKGNTGILDATSHATLDYNIAHGQWGHPGKEVLHRLPDATTGIDDIGPPTDKPCDGCAKGKMSCRPFPPSEKLATVVLALVHMDVTGPLGTSIGGYNYFCVFVDDYSGFAAVYALKCKSNQEKAFRQFKAWAETQTEYKIKKVHSDQGGGSTCLRHSRPCFVNTGSSTIRQCQVHLSRMDELNASFAPSLRRHYACSTLLAFLMDFGSSLSTLLYIRTTVNR